MIIVKVYVVNNKATGEMATDFDKATSYLQNCVANTITIQINLSSVDTDL